MSWKFEFLFTFIIVFKNSVCLKFRLRLRFAQKNHQKIYKNISLTTTTIDIVDEEDEVEELSEDVDMDKDIYVINDMKDWLNM